MHTTILKLDQRMLALAVAAVFISPHAFAQTQNAQPSPRDELRQSLEEATRAAREGVDAARKAMRAASAELKAKSAQARETKGELEESIHRIVTVSLDSASAALDSVAREVTPEVERTIAQVDINEIRDTVRRAMEDAERSSGYSFRALTRDSAERGNPYSARETREFKQTLSDGTVISRSSVRLLTRDGAGRTRQELRQPDGTARVYINDPVAKRAYVIDPQRRAACVAKFDSDSINDCLKQMRGDWTPLGFNFSPGSNGIPIMTAKDDVMFNVRPNAKVIDLTDKDGAWSSRGGTFSYSGSGTGAVAVAPGAVAVAGQGQSAQTPRDMRVVREKSTSTYEGLRVEVDRTVETIPAGSMGNNRPIETLNERFYAPELKMTVYSKRSDPRSGEFVYRMTEVKRSEPDASLFRIPSGFSESEGRSR